MAATTPTITRGDDVYLEITLQDPDGNAKNVSSATISASIVSLASGDRTSYVGPTAQSAAASGADWTNGVVIVEFPAASTSDIPAGDATVLLELQISIGGKKRTEWTELFVREGTIA